MRILHVVPTYLPATRYGGPIHSVHGLCRALRAAGHEVEVFTTSVDGPGDSDVPLGQAVRLDGVGVWYFRSRIGRRLYYSPPLARALREHVSRFDLVHLHSVFLWPTSTAARAATARNVPYVVSPRGMLVRELIESRSTAPKVAWLSLIESATLAQAASVHFTSQRELDDARALPLALPRPFIAPNGVDPAAEVEGSLRPVDPHVLYLGRISWKKNLETLIEALVGTDMQLRLIGPDDEGLTPRLRNLASTLGVADRVQFRPAVTPEARWEHLRRASVVVLPSHNENFGNVVPEAMAVGRPVVVSEGVGAREIVEASGAGRVCPPTAPGLRSALLSLWDDAAARRTAGQAGREHVARELTWQAVAARMADHYARLITTGIDRSSGAT